MHRSRSVRRIPIEPDIPLNHEPWMAFGACAAVDVQYGSFFPDEQEPQRNKQQELDGKQICASCSVAWQCLDFAIRNREIHGVWGGMNFAERCDLTQQYEGHTSPLAQAAHRRHLTELYASRKQAADVDRVGRLRAVG